VSSNCRPIALSSTLSTVSEWLILHKYSEFLTSSHVQFGFKSHSSTSVCTGMVKNVVYCYINNGSSVYVFFLDAFDLVDHNILFRKHLECGLPLLVVCFLLSWYSTQECRVRWGSCLFYSFGVSNGVCQGSVLSPLLYLEGSLSELADCGVALLLEKFVCWGSMLYLLLVPSALRIMLNSCCN
jgi:hypothetical protein